MSVVDCEAGPFLAGWRQRKRRQPAGDDLIGLEIGGVVDFPAIQEHRLVEVEHVQAHTAFSYGQANVTFAKTGILQNEVAFVVAADGGFFLAGQYGFGPGMHAGKHSQRPEPACRPVPPGRRRHRMRSILLKDSAP